MQPEKNSEPTESFDDDKELEPWEVLGEDPPEKPAEPWKVLQERAPEAPKNAPEERFAGTINDKTPTSKEDWQARDKDIKTAARLEVFLRFIMKGHTISNSCELAGLEERAVYRRRASDKGFAEAWNEAAQIKRQNLADELYKRAMEGQLKPVTHKGQVTDWVREHDNNLAVKVLENGDQESEWKKSNREGGFNGGGQTNINIGIVGVGIVPNKAKDVAAWEQEAIAVHKDQKFITLQADQVVEEQRKETQKKLQRIERQ